MAVDISNLVDTTRVVHAPLLEEEDLHPSFFYRFMKRLIDIVISAFACFVLAIPMVVVAILVKLDSPGPVFYKQERLGRNGKPFMLVKFRSMNANAEVKGAQWATDNDPRVTRFGNFMRKTRLDEIPQFFTVLMGDMSLIGPRPERKVFYDAFEPYVVGFKQRLAVKPGISGLAQVSGGYDLRPEDKIIKDVEYIKNQSLWLDAKIILYTLLIVLNHKGAR